MLLWQLIVVIAFASCTTSEEPMVSVSPNSKTRGLDNIESTYTVQQALQIANKKLQKKPTAALKAKTKAWLAKNKDLVADLPSDTVAYIVNYANKGGFVIIANDIRLENPVLAYNEKGNFTEDNLLARIYFLDRIEDYLASLNKNKSSKVTESTHVESAPVRRIIVEPQITIELSPFSPFNDKIAKEHPYCWAGLINISAANIISHSFKELVFHNNYYNFELINYALNQGPGFNPINTGLINTLGNFDDIPSSFIYSYDGSVSAFTQLIYDISKDSDTRYEDGTINEIGKTLTMPWKIKEVYENIGLTVTETSLNQDINEITSLLFDGYLVNVFTLWRMVEGGVLDLDFIKGYQGYVIDGCNVVIGNDNKIQDGEVHAVWGYGGIGDGYFAYPVLLSDDLREMIELYHIGVKGNL